MKRYVEHGRKVCARNRNSNRVESEWRDVGVGAASKREVSCSVWGGVCIWNGV